MFRYCIIILIGNSTVLIKFHPLAHEGQAVMADFLPGIGFYLGLQGDLGGEGVPGLGQNLPLRVDQHGPQIVLGGGDGVHFHAAGDEDIPLAHRLPLLKLGIPHPGFDVGNHPRGRGDHIGGYRLRPDFRRRVPLPDNDLRPGAVEV